MATLETERLQLRFTILADAEFIQKEFPHWDIVKYMTTRIPWPYPSDGAETFLRDVILPQMQIGEAYSWLIQLKQKGGLTPIGVIAYEKDNPKRLTRGFWLARDYHGHGYMTEASHLTNSWLFENTPIEAIETNNARFNTSSSRIKVKQGWDLVGIVDNYDGYLCGTTTQENWCLTREKWKKLYYDFNQSTLKEG